MLGGQHSDAWVVVRLRHRMVVMVQEGIRNGEIGYGKERDDIMHHGLQVKSFCMLCGPAGSVGGFATRDQGMAKGEKGWCWVRPEKFMRSCA